MIIATDTLQNEITRHHIYELLELAKMTTLDCRQKKWLSFRIKSMEALQEYEEIKKNLLLNVIERKDYPEMGFYYSHIDILKALKKLT